MPVQFLYICVGDVRVSHDAEELPNNASHALESDVFCNDCALFN